MIIFVSLVAIAIAFVTDPFSLPFQDWDQIPEQQQQLYIQRSQICTYFKYIGFSGLLIGIGGGTYNFIRKKVSVHAKKVKPQK